MTVDRRSRAERLNTFQDATSGQRLTAIVVALAASVPVGLLCAWLATGPFSDVHWIFQTLAFGVVGAVAGLGTLTLLALARRSDPAD